MFESDADFDFDGDFFVDTVVNSGSKNSLENKEADSSEIKTTLSDSNVKIGDTLPKTAAIESQNKDYDPKGFVSDKLKAFVFKRRAKNDKTKSEGVTTTVKVLESLPKRIHKDDNKTLVKTKEIIEFEHEINEAGTSKSKFKFKPLAKRHLETFEDNKLEEELVCFESEKQQISETTNFATKKICRDSTFDLANRAEIDGSKKLAKNRSISEIARINLLSKENETPCGNAERPFEFMDDEDFDFDAIFDNPHFKEQTINFETAEERQSSETFVSNEAKGIVKQNFSSKKQEFQNTSFETKSNALIPEEKYNFNLKKPPKLQNNPKPTFAKEGKEKYVFKTNENESGLNLKHTESPSTSRATTLSPQNEARAKRLSLIEKLSRSPRVVRKFAGPAGFLPERKDLGLCTFLLNGIEDKTDNLKPAQVIPCSQSTVNVFEDGPWMRMTEDFQVRDDNSIFLPGKYTVEWIKRTASSEKLINRKAPFLAAVVHKLAIVDMRLPVVNVFLKDMTGEIQGTISRDLYEQHMDEIAQGSVLVLRQFGVLTVSRAQKHFVNVTEQNLIAIYSQLQGQSEIVRLYLQKLTPADIIRHIETAKKLDRLTPRAIRSFGSNGSTRSSVNHSHNISVKATSSEINNLQILLDSSTASGCEKEVVQSLFEGFDTSCLFDDF